MKVDCEVTKSPFWATFTTTVRWHESDFCWLNFQFLTACGLHCFEISGSRTVSQTQVGIQLSSIVLDGLHVWIYDSIRIWRLWYAGLNKCSILKHSSIERFAFRGHVSWQIARWSSIFSFNICSWSTFHFSCPAQHLEKGIRCDVPAIQPWHIHSQIQVLWFHAVWAHAAG